MSRLIPQPLRPGCRGFSLIEIIAALAIMAMAVVALMQLYASSLRTLRNAEEHSVALLYARALLEEALASQKPEDLETKPSVGRGMTAEREAGRFEPEKAPAYYIITVRVSWPPRGSVLLEARRAAGADED